MNIVFFLVDDLGWSDVGYQGSTFYETPVIDSFAKLNVQFSQAYAASPVCSPTRSALLSGQYPARTRVTDWLPGRKDFDFQQLAEVVSAQHLPYGEQPLAKILKENGYATAIFGKWHLGNDSASAQRQGFDLHLPEYEKGWPNGTYFSPYSMNGLEGGPKGEYLTDRLTEEAMKWMEFNQFQPFFLLLSHYAVHDPLQGRGDLVVKYQTKLNLRKKVAGPAFIMEGNPDSRATPSVDQPSVLSTKNSDDGFHYFPDRSVKIKQAQDNIEFAAMVESIDESLAKVLAKLKELGLEDNTIVIFYSDNGGMSAANFGNPYRRITAANVDKAFSTSNLPLRAGKGWLYEGGVRVPLVIRWPAINKPIKSDIPVTTTDFYPTLLDMIGVSMPSKSPNGVDGMSLVPVFTVAKEQSRLRERALYWHWPNYSNHGQQSPGGAIRLGDYKLIEYFENNTVQLFNLKEDIGEQNDLTSKLPKKVQELRGRLHQWQKNVNAQMPAPNPQYMPGNKWPGN